MNVLYNGVSDVGVKLEPFAVPVEVSYNSTVDESNSWTTTVSNMSILDAIVNADELYLVQSLSESTDVNDRESLPARSLCPCLSWI